MLTRLAKTLRGRGAATLALAYVVCVLAPPVAHASSGNWAATHLTIGHHTTASVHAHGAAVAVHDDGTAHQHGTHHGTAGADVDDQGTPGGCCTYFCVSAAPAPAMPDVAPALGVAKTLTAANTGILGRGPGRIDRPPIVLLLV